ncbi:MAG: hypothetical protein C0631_11905 [Sedimenticola sp.]|nr:MAG: hypothetical protein C0631_11905 [Sedimenticola sp.]
MKLITTKRPLGLRLIILLFLLLPMLGFGLRLPPPLLLATILLFGLIAYGLYRYYSNAYWAALILLLFVLLIGFGVAVVTLWISHPEGYPESLFFLLFLAMLLSAVVYLGKSSIRQLFLD